MEKIIYKSAYAGYITNNEIRMKSSSGGIFSAFVQEIFLFKGVVYGVCEDKEGLFFIRADNWNIIEKMRGSKYYQADITRIDIKTLLLDIKNKKPILIIGTSCQIGMFYIFLKTRFSLIPDNVILVDLICHGVSSWKYVDKYRKEISKKRKNKLLLHLFRCKNERRKGSQFSRYIYENNKIDEINNEKDYYMRLYFGNFILRPSCYHCSYTRGKKYSDITVGDFNGSDRLIESYPDNTKCISAIIVNTNKGDCFLKNVEGHGFCRLKKTTYNFIAEQNLPLLFPSNRPKIRKYIFNLIDNLGFINTSKVVSIKYYIKQLIIFIGGKTLLNKLKKKMGRKIIE